MTVQDNFGINGETVLALGNFDGLHLGHMQVLKKALETAKELELIPAVMLFDQHPKKIIEGKRPARLLTDNDRDKMLASMGFRIIRVSFNELKDTLPEDFVMKAYCKFSVRAICCGFNYHYGMGGAGNVGSLSKSCKKLGIRLFALDEVDYDGEPVSSSRIRAMIECGNIKAANEMLGRRFSYKFEVVSGDQRGRLLGFPTINQFFPEDFVRARFGVYASAVLVASQWYPAVTNIGIRPTVKTEKYRSETCILGFSGNLYGEKIEVHLIDFIRDEKKFSSLRQLSETIALDAEKARQIYNKECNL